MVGGAMVIQITGAAAGSLFWIGNGNGLNKRHYCLMRLARSCNRLHHDNGSSLSSSSSSSRFRSKPQSQTTHGFRFPLCLPSSSSPITPSHASPKLYVSGLSFRTTEESLRNAFQKFGELVEVKLVMDRIANRPRGFAFLRYASEEESKSAIAGMHGKFLDGRVIFVEVARPRSELRQDIKRN